MSTWQSRRLVHPKTADQYFSKQCQKAETAPEFSWKLVPTTPLLVACNRCANSQSASPILSLSLCWAAPERRSFNYAIFYFRRNLQLKWASSPGQANARQTARPPTCLGSSYIVHLYVSMSMHLFSHFWLSFCYHNQTATLWSVLLIRLTPPLPTTAAATRLQLQLVPRNWSAHNGNWRLPCLLHLIFLPSTIVFAFCCQLHNLNGISRN